MNQSRALWCLWIVGAALAALAGQSAGPAAAQPPAAERADAGLAPAASQDGISVYFSPGGGITAALVREISAAKACVYVQAAQFTSAPIARALIDAHHRGVDVRVIFDQRKGDDDRAQIDRMAAAGVPVFSDGRHHTAHNKVTIIDHRLITTGSFNFTHESESENAENLAMIFDKPRLVAAYEKNFADHLGHSVRLQR